ncbi:MAG: DivIVA domain-containing protein [Syntrophomonadaceae bacterium]|nr:DivIVA domain-containing protein [Syntrophomonadaceae bacterium]MDD3023924.1 DivIVA domain-containing protein [Syntrophomonadaceae bacterium]
MITAMEIRNQHFRKSIRGYSEEEVKNFLVNLAQDYEQLYSENAQLKESIQRLEYDLAKYRKLEETMNNSLILAQQTAESVKANARKEAELMKEESKRRINEILTVYQEVIKRMNLFNVEMKAHISSEMEMLDKSQKKIEDLSDFFFSKDLKDIMENIEKVNIQETE